MDRAPDHLDPTTLRWLADEYERELKDHADLPRAYKSRLKEAMRKGKYPDAGTLREIADEAEAASDREFVLNEGIKRLRSLATRIETRRGKARG